MNIYEYIDYPHSISILKLITSKIKISTNTILIIIIC